MIRQQLSGQNLVWDSSMRLRNDISTDEITPAHICFYYDETLGQFPYVGLKAGEDFPIKKGDVRGGGFVVSVSGKRRGKGSSREASPYAELCAGIQLVIAESIERIYKQNCQNLGLLTSTNFGLLEKIRCGEAIPLEEFTRGEDKITRQIIEYGGLFPYNLARLRGQVQVPAITTPRRPMTMAEKIFARHFVKDLSKDQIGVGAVRPGDTGFVRTDLRFSHEYVTPMAISFFYKYLGPEAKIKDPQSVLFFRDHLTFLDEVMPPDRRALGLLDLATQLRVCQEETGRTQNVKLHGEIAERKGSEAICHAMMLESYALPGQLIIGSDSHTPHSGAIGCVAFGVGTTDLANAWMTKDVRVRVPETVRFVINGKRPSNVTAKDIVLLLLRSEYVRSGKALGKIIEYAGDAVADMDIDERATMTNMAAEIGGFTGLVVPDEKTVAYLMRERSLSRLAAETYCEGCFSDVDAEYADVITIDVSALRPMVALPGDPGNGVFVAELGREVRIDMAYGGSCTAGKKEDMDMYAQVFQAALAQGKRIHSGVHCYIQFGSQEVRRHAEKMGYLEIFNKVGAQTIEPSCGACINAGPGASTEKSQVVISAQNRNFPGRSGPGQLYLASPLTVAASAIAGVITEYKPGQW
ncbi:MAG: 3-isopropylmalate dehydratase [Acidobacteria bacterium]|nr:3-isopropylmalate dehydratase [Acidobacteriota bacterium]MBI3658445.1 3-isopropylmalate dehydratase [Acidobacteriota bacterium]